MSRLDSLIAELCPNGVEYVPLGKIGINLDSKRKPVTKGAREVGEYPYYGASGIVDYVSDYIFDGDFLLVSEDGANLVARKTPIAFSASGKIWVNNHAHVLQFETYETRRYIEMYLNSIDLSNYISTAAQPKLSQTNLNKIPIQLPPFEVQREIVRILDNFMELTAELTARKKQYNYYRDELLTFAEGEVQWKTLAEVSLEFGRGKSRHRPRNDTRLYGGDIPFIQTGDIRNASHIITEFSQTYSDFGLNQSKLWSKGTLCITIAANIAETAILGFDSCFPDSVIGFIADPQKTTSDYVEYLLQSFKSKLQSKSTGSAQDNINLATFDSLRLPFPPLEEQARIVEILDKFDALTSDLSQGLPAEITARQKQYEYYRDKLLNFTRSGD